MPSTPPSVTPEKEWTWYSPKARKALLNSATAQDIGFSFTMEPSSFPFNYLGAYQNMLQKATPYVMQGRDSPPAYPREGIRRRRNKAKAEPSFYIRQFS